MSLTFYALHFLKSQNLFLSKKKKKNPLFLKWLQTFVGHCISSAPATFFIAYQAW